MTKKPIKNRGLGRGLSALMADVETAGSMEDVSGTTPIASNQIAIELIAPNPDQPRRDFSEDELNELAESIRAHGVIQPLILRPSSAKQGTYEIVAGERRWRASQLAQLHSIPALIRDYSDQEILEVAIIENVQRQDLNPLEEALGYDQLIKSFGHTQQELATAMGKSRSYIANLLRLISLPESVKDFLRKGELTIGHARALITSDDPEGLAKQIVKGGLSVRQAEALAKSSSSRTQGKSKPSHTSTKDADTRVLEDELSAQLGMSVVIDHGATGDGGKLTIKYKSLENLDDLCRLLGGG